MESTGYTRCQLHLPRGKNETWTGATEYEHENDKDKDERKGKRKREKKKSKLEVSEHEEEDLWAPQKVLSSRKGSLSATYNKNTEANTKVFDLNQKTIQALDRLAGVYATFEDAWANLGSENSEVDTFMPKRTGAMDELAKAQPHQARCQDEVFCSCESLNIAFRKVNNCGALHGAACDDLADAGTKTIDLKRKADDAHDRTGSHKERCWRATRTRVGRGGTEQ